MLSSDKVIDVESFRKGNVVHEEMLIKAVKSYFNATNTTNTTNSTNSTNTSCINGTNCTGQHILPNWNGCVVWLAIIVALFI